MPHVVVMLYALPGKLAALPAARSKRSAPPASSGSRCLTTSDLDGIEPFGFMDGISQPLVDWQRKRRAKDARAR